MGAVEKRPSTYQPRPPRRSVERVIDVTNAAA